jgi:hypothetical protein
MTAPVRSSMAPGSITDWLNRLQALVTTGPPRFPLGRRSAWEEEAVALIQQLRDAWSDDAGRAQTLAAEAEVVLRRAQDEARRIVLEAESHARRGVEDGSLARAVEQQTQQIREQAVREADETRRGADIYALTVLERLERETARILAAVQRGKAVLSERTGVRILLRRARRSPSSRDRPSGHI